MQHTTKQPHKQQTNNHHTTKQHKHKNTTIVHHPTVTYFIKHTYSLTLIHIIYNIMHIFNCLREHLDNTKTAETYLNINLLKICKRLIFFTL